MDPFWISAVINNRPDGHLVIGKRVVDGMGKHATQKAIVTVNPPVNSRRNAKTIDIRFHAGFKVITQSDLLIFIEPEAFIDSLERGFGE